MTFATQALCSDLVEHLGKWVNEANEAIEDKRSRRMWLDDPAFSRCRPILEGISRADRSALLVDLGMSLLSAVVARLEQRSIHPARGGVMLVEADTRRPLGENLEDFLMDAAISAGLVFGPAR